MESVHRPRAAWQPRMWMWLSALALASSLIHNIIDWHIGLFGPSSSGMSWLQAVSVLMTGLLFAWWGLSFAASSARSKAGQASLLVLVLGYSFLANGVVGLASCPPACSAAFPYQDVAHLANVAFGGAASYSTWRLLREKQRPLRWSLPLVAVVLLIAAIGSQAVLAAGIPLAS